MAKEKESPKSGAKKPERKTIQVRATRLGYYGNMLRPPGTIFNFRPTEHEDCPPWCVRVEDGTRAPDEPDLTSDTAGEPNGSSSDDVI